MELWQPLHGGLFKHQIKDNKLSVQYLNNTGQFFSSESGPINIDALVTENEQFNPHLDTTNEVILETLVECFKKCDEEQLKIYDVGNDDQEARQLSIETMFYEMKFRWMMVIPGADYDFQEGVLNPFLNTIQLLLKQQALLEKTLKKKDAEISEFRSLGVKLSKKSVLSPPYDRQTLTTVKLDSELNVTLSLASKEVQEVFRRAGVRERIEKVKSKSKVVKMGVRFSDDESGDDVKKDNDVKKEDDQSESLKRESVRELIEKVQDGVKKEEADLATIEELNQAKIREAHERRRAKKRKKRSL